MEHITKNLGKVTLTCDDIWSIDKAYDRLTVVAHNGMSFISKVDVREGIDILNTDYWQQFGAMKDIINNPDEEDITQVDNKLKFKDRIPNDEEYIEYGVIYLRRNIVNGKNIIDHSMLTEMYTTYVVNYTYDLNGATLYVPEGCGFDFQGGKFIGSGAIVFANTRLEGILKLSDGFDVTIDVQGTFENGQVLMVDGVLKYWKDGIWTAVGSDFEFDVKAVETVDADQPANVEIEKQGDLASFVFKIPRGYTGADGAPGKDGNSILSARTVFAFKVSATKPATPVGGSWNSTTDAVTFPSGWGANDPGVGITWMSTAIFGVEGIRGSWSVPIRITGDNGKDGEDGTSTEFIYKLTVDGSAVPSKPVSQNIDDHVPLGWTDSPQGVSLSNKAEWVCTRTKDGNWGEWTVPALWSRYGVDGRDGDGIEYIYKLTNTSVPPTRPTTVTQEPEYVPATWTDNPTGVSKTNMWEWVSVRKFRDKLWSEFSNPALWAKYGEDGQDGANGISTIVLYAKTTDSSVVPALNASNINPGSIWSNILPSYSGNEAIWGIQGLVNINNELLGAWQGPYLITGVNGKNGVPVNYKTYVYKLSDTKPNKPIGNDPSNVGNGWLDYPNTTGNWWQCIGNVNGYTNLVITWGEVIPLNGRDGTAQDGKFTEFRFAKSATTVAPTINKTLRTPAGWTKTFPVLGATETLWMVSAEINPDDTLVETWNDPVRISGEKGIQGSTGPAGNPGPPGSQGVPGIPGIDIELRFSLGTDLVPDATWNSTVKTTRNPLGWAKAMPAVTGTKLYIWMIQCRIIRSGDSDIQGALEGSGWSEPFRLNGINGLDGEQGKKGQVIYPMGVYANNVRYITTETKAPYVYDPSDGNFYVLNAIMSWLGTEQSDRTPSQDFAANAGKYWLKFEAFEALYTKIGIIANGLIGSAVFNGDWMFSQNGFNGAGTATTQYQNFNASILDSEYTGGASTTFIPAWAVNLKLGKQYFVGNSELNNLLYRTIIESNITNMDSWLANSSLRDNISYKSKIAKTISKFGITLLLYDDINNKSLAPNNAGVRYRIKGYSSGNRDVIIVYDTEADGLYSLMFPYSGIVSTSSGKIVADVGIVTKTMFYLGKLYIDNLEYGPRPLQQCIDYIFSNY